MILLKNQNQKKKKSFVFKLFFNHSGMVLALSKGPEHPKKLIKKID